MFRKTLVAGLLATVTAAPASAQGIGGIEAELAAMRAKIEQLEAEVTALKAAQAATPAAAPPATAQAQAAPVATPKDAPESPVWRGAPQFVGKDGFSFKPRGFVQFDAGTVSTPGPEREGIVGGLNYNNLGWNSRSRRIVFGAQGTLPGGFAYNAEFNFTQGQVDYEDIIITYQRPRSPWLVTIGNFFPLSGLDSVTSSRVTTMLERSANTETFGLNRRLGVSLAYADPKNDSYMIAAGIFGQEINNTNAARTGWQASARALWSPKLGDDTRLHLGANFQHRVAQQDAQNVQYRVRPMTQLTDQRFIDTAAIAADGDDIFGVELAAIHGPLHAVAEAQRVWVRGFRPGHAFGPNDGAGNGLFYSADPVFGSAYGEIGFYLTGESRGYRGGRWDRVKVRRPFDKGGWGALQANARIEYVDLTDRVAGTSLLAPDFINGGRQLGYAASLIWNPTDYLRFMAQYTHLSIEGGPRAATVVAGSAEPLDERGYDVDTFGLRAQVEF
ncbi:OprO/OprP family phosphate-selective porin [Sphingosinicella sp. BN140058]|uniref:OprO/OprP family phosphate-selective porin n=1 Tax=Sphingosinicella sp. BN140058 TaxID=1892855 RepID=UPI0013EB462E|nr:porin [Sphingosinicella sp. BN140058]